MSEIDGKRLRENLMRFRANLRKSLGLPPRPVRLVRERLVWRRLSHTEEEPKRAVRRVVYDSEGLVVREEVKAPLSLTASASTPSATTAPETSSLSPGEAMPVPRAHTPPAPSAGPEERPRVAKTVSALQQILEARREYGILWNIRKAVKVAVEATQRELKLEEERRRAEIEAFKERLRREREEAERRSRGLHY